MKIAIFSVLKYFILFSFFISTIALSAELPRNTVRLHYHRVQNDFTGWGLHLWGEDLQLTKAVNWFSPFKATGKDKFGIYFDIPVKPNATTIGLF